ncbi:hypothetical protein EE612_020445, partial [Oryza sativa]
FTGFLRGEAPESRRIFPFFSSTKDFLTAT